MQLPEQAPDVRTLLVDLMAGTGHRFAQVFGAGTGPEPEGRYLHWDELRHRTPPGDLSAAEWWTVVGWKREALRTGLPPLADQKERPFWFARTASLDEGVHWIDRR